MNHAADKIRMMQSSIRCLVSGLLGLVPLIGLPFAFSALWISGRARASEKRFWNPARPYRVWGTICGAVGAVIWGVVLIFIIGRLLIFTYDSG